jgi:hypothetical protein
MKEIIYRGIDMVVDYELYSAPMYEDEDNYGIEITGLFIGGEEVSELFTDEMKSEIQDKINEKL